MSEGWVLVKDGTVVDGTNGESPHAVAREYFWTSGYDDMEAFAKEQGYTFQKFVPLPEGCKVCRPTGARISPGGLYDRRQKWEPV